MDNASKNAGDMINKFSLLYNRLFYMNLIDAELVKLSLRPNSSISSLVPVQFNVAYKIEQFIRFHIQL
jgi:hypothetical protein